MQTDSSSDIAVIGMAGRFPGAADLDAFWRLLAEGREGLAPLPDADLRARGVPPLRLNDPRYVKVGSIMPDAWRFDAEFFEWTAAQASITDPQLRVFLECAWHALEHAGYTPDAFNGAIGVFGGSSLSTFLSEDIIHTVEDGHHGLYTSSGMRAVIATQPDYVTTLVSYQLDLRGPSLDVQTACSTSLVAIHLACQSLLAGECEMALAGGVKVRSSDERGYLPEEGSLMSPDGQCRAFDAAAKGTIFGSGVGIVALRRLSDALADGDRILAVIKGSAINNDGSAKVGFTAPGVRGQAEVITQALAVSGVDPATIDYVEAHGTGTAVGDPIEVAALTRAFRRASDRRRHCAIGSVKTNVGHLESAAGVAGLIKAVLALKNRQIPPSLHFEHPSPAIDFENGPFYVPTALQPWPARDRPRRAGVSSFGIGGTNAHLVLEEAPAPEPITATAPDRPLHLYTVSARTAGALDALLEQHAARLLAPDAPALADAAFTANTGRVAFRHRAAAWGANPAEVAARLRAGHRGEAQGRPRVALLFTGQGAGFPAMARALYDACPPAREDLDRLDQRARKQGYQGLLDVLLNPARGSDLSHTLHAQPAIYALEVTIARLWQSWGVEPVAVLGHSLGEYAAAAIAGVFDIEAGLDLVIARARAMAACGGAMAAVFATEDRITPLLAGGVVVSARNGPDSLVLSGAPGALEDVTAALAKQGIRVRKLNVGCAFHSPQIEPSLPALRAAAAAIPHRRPKLKLVSNVTGAPLDAIDPAEYWVQHARTPVAFAAGAVALGALGCDVFIEVGPGSGLLSMVRGVHPEGLFLPSLRESTPLWESLLDGLSRLFVSGLSLRGAAFDRPWSRRRVELPLYPFQRRLFLPPAPPARKKLAPPCAGHPLRGSRLDTAVPIFEGQIDLETSPWLADHVVGGRTLLPGTGFIEIAAAAAAELYQGVDLRDVAFRHPMTLAAGTTRTSQITFEPDGQFRIFSRFDEGAWEMHATGRAVRSEERERLPLEDWKRECTEAMEPSTPYTRLRGRNIHLGPRFQVVQSLSRRPESADGLGVALARLSLPRGLSGEGFQAHPALLDGLFQTAVAAMTEAGSGSPMVPAGIDRVRISGPLPAELWCRAEVPEGFGGNDKARMWLCDDEGNLLASFEGLRSAALDVPASADWIYAPAFRPIDTPAAAALPAPDALRAAIAYVREEIGPVFDEAWNDRIQRSLDGYTAWAAGNALVELGWSPARGQTVEEATLATNLGVLASHRRLFHRLLEILVEERVLSARSSSLTFVGPWPAPPADLDRPFGDEAVPAGVSRMVARCGRGLSGALSGRLDALDLLFPGGSTEDVGEIYARSPVADAWHRVAAELVGALVRSLPSDAPLRILEIGAGTGSSSAEVLPHLPAERSTYVFTDISAHFLSRAKARFEAYPFLETRLLDIDRDPAAQGFAQERFHVILAANVLHATTDLRLTAARVRDLLLPGGLLLVIEPIRVQRWTDITFGLTEGWWRFTDDLRTVNPIASEAAWSRLLHETGFEEAGSALDRATVARDRSGHTILLARRSPGQKTIVGQGGALAEELTRVWHDRGARVAAAGDLAADDVVFIGEATLPEQPEEASDALARYRTRVLERLLLTAKETSGRLHVVTRGGASVNGEAMNPTQAALWGAAHTLGRELGERWGGIVDLDPALSSAEQAEVLADALTAAGAEHSRALRGGQAHVLRMVAAPEALGTPARPRADGTYLVTGGLGGIGRRLARWLVEGGAGAVVLLGRNPPSDEIRAELARLGRVHVEIGDAADGEALAALLGRLRSSLPPLRGVFHAAGVLADARVPDMTPEQLHEVLRPKIDGAWWLHLLTREDPLDWFVLFSSGGAVFGNAGQFNHSAANAFMDGLAWQRHAQGLPALTVNWGRWSDVGIVRAASIGDRLAALGIGSFTGDEGISILSRLLGGGRVQVAVTPIDQERWHDRDNPIFKEIIRARPSGATTAQRVPWSVEAWANAAGGERIRLVESWLRAQIANLLGLAGPDAVSLDAPLSAAGLDSLMAVDLRARLSSELGVPVVVGDLIATPSARESAERIYRQLLAREVVEVDATTAEQEWEEVQL